MALIECWECGKQISDTAAECPQCGAYKKYFKDVLPWQQKPLAMKIWIIFVCSSILAGLWYVYYLFFDRLLN
ncbi:MAG: zinc ribbon domain-containing protein [Nitrospina sp.]|jgi:predicted amidophosphoribosyltransferase|nr:zinc ribbon domain-containing protein [Nitrospina sp.]